VGTTACGGDDTSVADPPISPPSSSSSPTNAPPRESPEHFIRRWAAAEKRMENTGKTNAYLSISDDCKACRQLAADIARYYSAGGSVRWGGWDILSIEADGTVGKHRAYVVEVESAPTTYRVSASSPERHLPGGRSTHQLTLERVDGQWHMLVKAQLAA
jgi:hypothetical protein